MDQKSEYRLFNFCPSSRIKQETLFLYLSLGRNLWWCELGAIMIR
jgi:hypothetical protein